MAQQIQVASARAKAGGTSRPQAKTLFSIWGLAVALATISCSQASPPREPHSSSVAEVSALEPPSASLTGAPTEQPVLDAQTNKLRAVRRVSVRHVSHLSQGLKTQWERNESRRHAIPLAFPHETWLALDHHSPRYSKGRRLRLVDLVNEDEEVAPGSHTLYLIRTFDEVVELQVHSFSLEVHGGHAGKSPACILFRPLGTINGAKASGEIEFLGLPTKPGPSKISYAIGTEGPSGRLVWSTLTDLRLGDVGVAGLGSGDHRVKVSCEGAAGRLETSERVITVNADAVVGQAK